MAGKLKGQAFWSVLLQFSRLGGNAIVFLAMARFLSIEEIGAFGLAFAPIRWTQDIFKGGIVQCAVITLRQRDETGQIADEQRRFTALFWLSMAAAALVTACIAAIAFALSALRDYDQPVSLMMLAMLAVPISFAVAGVPDGLLQKRLQMRALALRTLVVQLAAAIMAVVLALMGFGGWALVGFAVVNAVLGSAISIYMAGWRPSGGPDLSKMRSLLPQVAAISGRSLMSNGVYAMLQFATGLFLGLQIAGAFQIAQRVYQILDALCLGPIRFLVLPLFSRAAEANGGRLPGNTVLRALQIAGLISAPIYLGTAAISAPALTAVIGAENAQHSIRALQLMCLISLSYTSTTMLSQAITVAGYANLAFLRAIWVFCATCAFALPGMLISLDVAILGFAFASYLVLFFFYRRLEAIFGVKGIELFLAVGRPYLAGAVAMVVVWYLQFVMLQNEIGVWLTLATAVPLGIALYLGALMVFARDAFAQVKSALRG